MWEVKGFKLDRNGMREDLMIGMRYFREFKKIDKV
jgi:hypothetical protein